MYHRSPSLLLEINNNNNNNSWDSLQRWWKSKMVKEKKNPRKHSRIYINTFIQFDPWDLLTIY